MLAAYVVVLQALLLPLTVAAGAHFDSSICVASEPTGKSAPASHDPGCGCAAGCGMHCGAQSMGEPPPSFTGLLPAFAQVTAPAPPIEAVARTCEKRPQNPRAPPVA
ncbi:MAG: hypothetical protein Q8M26_10235 [Pseudolabrys sp.]|nr:hypothetical protein [Pseudolabrys sp.]